MTQDLPPTGDSVNIRSPQSEAKAQAVASQGQTVIVNTTPPESKSKFPVWVIPVVIALLGVTAVVAFLAGNQLGRGNAPAAGSVTPQVLDRVVQETVLTEKQVTAEVTRLATVVVDNVVTQVIEVPVTRVIKETVERQVTVLVPQTIVVGKVVAPSATPLPPTPVVTLPFEDDFNGKRRPEWSTVTGEWRILNQERLIPITRDGSLSVIRIGDPGWRNYTVDLDYFDCSSCQLWVRSPKPGDGLIFTFGNFTSNSWQVCRGGQCEVLTGFGSGANTAKLRIEVLDDSFSASINGVNILSITDFTYQTGAVGIGVFYKGYDATFDNFKIAALP